MRFAGRYITSILASVFAVFVLLPAGAQGSSRMQAKLRLTSSIPGTPTGGILNLTRPDGADGKPKTEAVGVFRLPPGTIVNRRAVPPCTKDDTTLQAEAYAACPDSHIGNGFASLYSGLGPPVDPFDVDQQWYYGPDQLLGLNSAHDRPVPVLKVSHVRIEGTNFIAPLDLPPGYPPGTKTSPRETKVTIQPYIGPHGAFLTTPAVCPSSRKWITSVFLRYDDGSTDEVADATPCTRAKAHHRHKRRHHRRHRHRGHHRRRHRHRRHSVGCRVPRPCSVSKRLAFAGKALPGP